MKRNTIQCTETDLKWLVHKVYDNMIKKGTDILVRPGQEAVLYYDGIIADRFAPGRYTLDEKSMPKLMALGERFVFPKKAVRSDIYYLNTTIFMNNGWGTKNPIICKDSDLKVVRMTAFGSFSFQITDTERFIDSVFGTRIIGTETQETIKYISDVLSESVAETLAQSPYSILEIAAHYSDIANLMKEKALSRMQDIGITLTEVRVEHIGTTDTVNETIDDVAGMNLVKDDLETFERFRAAREKKKETSKPVDATIMVNHSEGGMEIGSIRDKD